MVDHVGDFQHSPINGEVELQGASGWAAAAAASATAAATSATEAGAYATTASGHATTANDYVTLARAWAIQLVTPVEGSDYSSKYNANLSATSAAAASAAQLAAEAALDAFEDTYLGAYASPPSVTPNGTTLADGMLYFDTTDDKLQVFNTGAWRDITIGGGGGGGGPGFHQYAAAPIDSIGDDGDTYLNTLTGEMFLKAAATWGTSTVEYVDTAELATELSAYLTTASAASTYLTIATAGSTYATLTDSRFSKGFASIVTEATTTRNVLLTDENDYIRCTNASATTVTIDPEGTTAYGSEFTFHVRAVGAGGVTVAPGSGVTINGKVDIPQNEAVTYIKVGTNEWDAIG